MSIFQIADKTTMDKIDNDVTAIKARGGFKKEGNILYGYDVANSTWEEINFAGLTGANPTLIVLNQEMSMTGKPVTVSIAGGWYQKTQIMPNAKYDVFVLPKLGSYNVTWKYSKSQKTNVVNVNQLGGVTTTVVYYPSFAEATWDQMSSLLTRAYNDSEFDLRDIWDVGDKRNVEFTTGAKDVVILDFDYDTLTTAIGNNTKAKVSVAVDGVWKTGVIDSTDDRGARSGWAGQSLRTLCTNDFYNDMPSGLKSIVKATSRSGQSDIATLISTDEYKGTNKYSYLADSANIGIFDYSWTRNLRHNSSIGVSYWTKITTNYGTAEQKYNSTANVVPIFSI